MTRHLQFNSDQLPRPLLPAALLGGAVRAPSARLLRSLSLVWGWRAGNVLLPGAVSDTLILLLLRELQRFCAPQREGGLWHRFSRGNVLPQTLHWGPSRRCSEVIRDGDSGVLVDGSELPTPLPEAILRLLRDPALRGTMGANGGAEFESNFSFSCFRDQLEQILCSPGHRVTMTPYAGQA